MNKKLTFFGRGVKALKGQGYIYILILTHDLDSDTRYYILLITPDQGSDTRYYILILTPDLDSDT